MALPATAAAAVLTGDATTNKIIGTSEADTIYGNDGNDGNVSVDPYSQRLIVGTFFGLWGQAANDTLYGGNGNDALFGGTGADVLDGGTGDDYLSSAGTYAIVTSTFPTKTCNFLGTCTLSYNQVPTVDETGARVSEGDVLRCGDGYDTIKINVKDTYTSCEKADVTGTDGAETFQATISSTIDTLAGNDTVYGSTSNDSIRAGGPAPAAPLPGHYVQYQTYSPTTGFGWATAWDPGGCQGTIGGGTAIASDLDWATGGGGDDSLYGGRSSDTLYGGNGNDTVTGESGNDFLYGGPGDDRLVGIGGGGCPYGAETDNDWLQGGPGNDEFFGGLGDDTFVVNEPFVTTPLVKTTDKVHCGEGFDKVTYDSRVTNLVRDADCEQVTNTAPA